MGESVPKGRLLVHGLACSPTHLPHSTTKPRLPSALQRGFRGACPFISMTYPNLFTSSEHRLASARIHQTDLAVELV